MHNPKTKLYICGKKYRLWITRQATKSIILYDALNYVAEKYELEHK